MTLIEPSVGLRPSALACTIAAIGLSASNCAAQVSLSPEPDRVTIEAAHQQLEFVRGPDGRFRLSTYVRTADGWSPLFDGQAPILQGPDFDLHPSQYRVLENTPERAAVEFSGRQGAQGFPWELRVEVSDATDLVHLSVACHIRDPLTLRDLEPQFALWMTRQAVELSVNQGPGNIYQGPADREWGNSFPAAYLWDKGVEAAIFFDMTPVTWMSHRNLFRFRDCRVQAFPENGRTGFGLRVVRRNFHEVSPEELRFEGYLYTRPRPEKPTRLEALDTLIEVFAPLHPSRAEPMRLGTGGAPSWEEFAEGVADDLMLERVVWDDIQLPADAPWRDEPAFPEETVDTLRVSCDYAVDSACDDRWNRAQVTDAWDFSTCYNYLAPLLAYDRLHPDARRRGFLTAKVRCLPLFFDPKAGLIRHGTRYPQHIGDREMSWQNLMFALETAKISRMLAPDDCAPEVAGRFLMAVDSLIEFAHNVDYLFPQWFDPYAKTAIPQGDLPELGVVYEPWQAGTYAQVMCEAHAITGDAPYLDEAQAAMQRLFGGLSFTVANERYEVTYDDPVDFPITEIFGNAWGVAAAYRVYRLTGDELYRQYSDYFLDSLLRVTYWYESELREDPKDLAMRTAGLFRNHAGAFTGSPWENSEAYLALLQRVRDDPEPRAPLLRLFNLYRTNSFTYFPAAFPEEAVPCPKVRNHAAVHLPIEDAYTHEHGGANGAMGRSVYMSGIALWNYLMFEAFAVADDPRTMVLSLDVLGGFDEAVASAARNLLVYNPGAEAKAVRVGMRVLADGEYAVRVVQPGEPDRTMQVAASDLREGLPLRLPPDGHARVTLHNTAAEQLTAHPKRRRLAGDRIGYAYALLQRASAGAVMDGQTAALKSAYRSAEAALAEGDVEAAVESASPIVPALRDAVETGSVEATQE